jgi:hypothetical protein
MKTDLVKLDKEYYSARTTAAFITVKPSNYISIEGKGDPSFKPFSEKISALYAVAYGLKFQYKSRDKDFTVSKLEGLWWYDENKFKDLSATQAPTMVPRSEWHYQLLIRLPDYILKKDIIDTKMKIYDKKKLEDIKNVEEFKLSEGKSVQILHKGSYDREPETLALIHDFMKKNNLTRNGVHHEIYLKDARKTEPNKLKTILRQPVK